MISKLVFPAFAFFLCQTNIELRAGYFACLVKNPLRRMKKGKAVGPDELPVEVWKCMGKMGIEFLTRLFNRLLMGERMPEE